MPQKPERAITRGAWADRIFEEEWAKKFPAEDPRQVIYSLWFGASLVEEFGFVSVDGGRAALPFPRIQKDRDASALEITQTQLAIAKAVNFATDARGSYFHRYIQRFTVVAE